MVKWIILLGHFWKHPKLNVFSAPGEPSYPNRSDCVRLSSGHWQGSDGVVLADNACHVNYHAICERSAISPSSSPRYSLTTWSLVTWPLCHVGQASRGSRLQCARRCSDDVTCSGFEFDDVTTTCHLVTLKCSGGEVFSGGVYLADILC